jgi:hypothetical protein
MCLPLLLPVLLVTPTSFARTIQLPNNVARDQTLSRNAPDRRFVQLRAR